MVRDDFLFRRDTFLAPVWMIVDGLRAALRRAIGEAERVGAKEGGQNTVHYLSFSKPR